MEVDNFTILSSKTADFLSPAQNEPCESTKPYTSTSPIIDPSQTTPTASSESEDMSIEGAEGHDESSSLD